MHPILFKLKVPGFLQGILGEELTMYSYGFMMLLGVIVLFLYTWYRRKEFGLDADTISEMIIWGFVGVFVGGKLFFYLENPSKYIANPSAMFKNMGAGFVFFGSFLVAIPTLVWFFKRKKLRVLPMYDLIAVGGALLHGIGKIGCFLSGCCHGTECHGGACVTYTHPESSARPLDTPLYPTQIYDAILIFGIAFLLMFLYSRKQFHGQLILLYAIIYGVGRCITEIYRGDEARGYIIDGVLSHSQFIAIFILAGSIYLWRKWSRTQAVFDSKKYNKD